MFNFRVFQLRENGPANNVCAGFAKSDRQLQYPVFLGFLVIVQEGQKISGGCLYAAIAGKNKPGPWFVDIPQIIHLASLARIVGVPFRRIVNHDNFNRLHPARVLHPAGIKCLPEKVGAMVSGNDYAPDLCHRDGPPVAG